MFVSLMCGATPGDKLIDWEKVWEELPDFDGEAESRGLNCLVQEDEKC